MDAAPGSLGRYRWFICLLLFFATTVNYVDRQILALLKPILDEQLRWTNSEFGRANAAFQGAYAVGLLLFGAFVDRFGTKIGYAISIAAWSVAAIGHAFVGTVSGFVRARVALGLGEGGNFPAAIKAVADWFPKKERALATVLFNSGANVGAILAPAVVPPIAAAWGWQAAFLFAGGAGLLWLTVWIPLYERPERTRRLSASELYYIRAGAADDAAARSAPRSRTPWLALLRYRQAWSFIVGKFLTDPVWWFFLIWLPDYFKKTRGLDLKKSWVQLVCIYSIVTVLSIAGGWLAGKLARRPGWSATRARKTSMLIFALAVIPIVFVTKVGTWGAVLLIGIAGGAHQAWSASLFTTVSDMFPQRAVASVVGMGGMAGSLGGILFPIVTGALLDRFQAAGQVGGGYALLFTFCGSAYLAAFGLGHLLAPRFERVPLAEDAGS
jgi:ACS family hexuronate transporter-like MFS transporter